MTSEYMEEFLTKNQPQPPLYVELLAWNKKIALIRCRAPIFLTRALRPYAKSIDWGEEIILDPSEIFIPEKALNVSGTAHAKSEDILDEMAFSMIEPIQAYSRLIDEGVHPLTAEQVLPQAAVVEWTWTGDVESFAKVYMEAFNPKAIPEFKLFSHKLRGLVRSLDRVQWKASTGEE